MLPTLCPLLDHLNLSDQPRISKDIVTTLLSKAPNLKVHNLNDDDVDNVQNDFDDGDDNVNNVHV